ncbi:MAG: hypothetical protein KIG14_02450 [Candidatus Sacchiramonaceae bacterium]|nr:hypothetical protein [Candidatus Saccharimonadaceae bacterium]
MTARENKPNFAFKDTLKQIIKDRPVFLCMIIMFIAGLSFFLFTAPNVEIFDHLIYNRYTIYGSEHYYRDRWFYRIAVALFGLLIALGHNAIAVKLHKTKNRSSIFILTLFTVIVTILGFIIMGSVLREIPN